MVTSPAPRRRTSATRDRSTRPHSAALDVEAGAGLQAGPHRGQGELHGHASRTRPGPGTAGGTTAARGCRAGTISSKTTPDANGTARPAVASTAAQPTYAARSRRRPRAATRASERTSTWPSTSGREKVNAASSRPPAPASLTDDGALAPAGVGVDGARVAGQQRHRRAVGLEPEHRLGRPPPPGTLEGDPPREDARSRRDRPHGVDALEVAEARSRQRERVAGGARARGRPRPRSARHPRAPATVGSPRSSRASSVTPCSLGDAAIEPRPGGPGSRPRRGGSACARDRHVAGDGEQPGQTVEQGRGGRLGERPAAHLRVAIGHAGSAAGRAGRHPRAAPCRPG